MNILLIDNYDSFTYNLCELIFLSVGVKPTVKKNDQIMLSDILKHQPDCIVISPGPGHPGNVKDFGVCKDAILYGDMPILGVCLGHQGIALTFGGEVIHGTEPVHGVVDQINHLGHGLFSGIPQRFDAVRYHSLVVSQKLPVNLMATAWTDDGVIMGLKHKTKKIYGIQFHPESICSQFGEDLMLNFFSDTVK